MTLLLAPDALAARRTLVRPGGVLHPLAASLHRELHASLPAPPLPLGKARLTRHGGRCPRCTVLLVFDPAEPVRHRCPQCGAVVDDPEHHEYWRLWAHQWTAEQALRGALLDTMLDDYGHAWEMRNDGTWHRRSLPPGTPDGFIVVDSQDQFMQAALRK